MNVSDDVLEYMFINFVPHELYPILELVNRHWKRLFGKIYEKHGMVNKYRGTAQYSYPSVGNYITFHHGYCVADPWIMKYLIDEKNTNLLSWAYNHGFPWNEKITEHLIKQSNPEVVQWFMNFEDFDVDWAEWAISYIITDLMDIPNMLNYSINKTKPNFNRLKLFRSANPKTSWYPGMEAKVKKLGYNGV